MACSCECGNENSSSIKRGELLDYLRSCWLLIKDCAACSDFVITQNYLPFQIWFRTVRIHCVSPSVNHSCELANLPTTSMTIASLLRSSFFVSFILDHSFLFLSLCLIKFLPCTSYPSFLLCLFLACTVLPLFSPFFPPTYLFLSPLYVFMSVVFHVAISGMSFLPLPFLCVFPYTQSLIS